MHLALLGDVRGRLEAGWTRAVVVSLLGDVELDATAPPGPDARVRVISLAGDTTVAVPAGARVTGGGVTLAAERSVDVAPLDGPPVRIDAFTRFGDVEVRAAPV